MLELENSTIENESVENGKNIKSHFTLDRKMLIHKQVASRAHET